jgi:hypothetical protein
VELTADTGSEAYLALGQELLVAPTVSPRGMPSRELTDVTLVIRDPGRVHVLETTRVPRLSIAVTEATHLVAGISCLEQLDAASGDRFSVFANGGRLRGAYGPRAHAQLREAFSLLCQDRDTRQAVVSLWRGDEHRADVADVPCTTTLQFLLRDGQLRLRVTMRSNDYWLGLPYDLMMFSLLQRTMAVALGVTPGEYVHAVGSMHAYERDLVGVESVVTDGLHPWRGSVSVSAGVPLPPRAARGGDASTWDEYVAGAEALCLRQPGQFDPWRADDHGTGFILSRLPKPPSHSLCLRCRYVIPDGQPCPECVPASSTLDHVLDEVRAEHHRARAKHGEHSLDGSLMDDTRRLAALMEEVGEAAGELTYDKDSDVRLRVELIQVANVAVTWATILPTTPGDET